MMFRVFRRGISTGPCKHTIEAAISNIHQNTRNTLTSLSQHQQLKQSHNILQQANVLHHAIQYQNHLAAKIRRTPQFYNALFNDQSITTSKQQISFDDIQITSLNDEVLSESIIKQVTLNEQITLRCEWRIEANRVHNLGVNTWACILRVGKPGQTFADMSRIVDTHDCSHESEHRFDTALLHQWQTDLTSPFADLGVHDFAWLVTDLLTFPSDHAFDVLSRSLMSNQR